VQIPCSLHSTQYRTIKYKLHSWQSVLLRRR